VYLPAATQLKFLTAETNGALTGLVSEALEGLDVIQAYKKQNYFIHESESRLNLYHRFFFNSECLNLWLAFYCDFFGAVLVLAVSMFAVFMKDEYKPADVGLAFSNVIQMLVFYTWVIRFLADTISYWGSMERISGLATKTPQETELQPALQPGTSSKSFDCVLNSFFADLTVVYYIPCVPGLLFVMIFGYHYIVFSFRDFDFYSLLRVCAAAIKVTVSPDAWKPTKGVVRFENVWMRYKHSLPWALKGVSFEFQQSEKIGVVGR
jgi:ATP-binding cassette, subfamily C (CFTR/MRP), member 1